MSNTLHTLDDRDKKILKSLQVDAKLSNTELAERLNLSASACLRRVRQLEESGFIDKYVALLNRKSSGYTGTAWVFIRLERQRQDVFQTSESAIHTIAEVQECFLMSGDSDYLVKVVYTDAEHFEEVYFNRLLSLPGVIGTQTRLALRTIYDRTEIPV